MCTTRSRASTRSRCPRPASTGRWCGRPISRTGPGYEAKIELKEPLSGRKRFRGVLEGVEDGEVRIEVELGPATAARCIGLPIGLDRRGAAGADGRAHSRGAAAHQEGQAAKAAGADAAERRNVEGAEAWRRTGISANRLELLQIADAVAREKTIDRKIVIAGDGRRDPEGRQGRATAARTTFAARSTRKTGETKLTRVVQVVEQVENDRRRSPSPTPSAASPMPRSAT